MLYLLLGYCGLVWLAGVAAAVWVASEGWAVADRGDKAALVVLLFPNVLMAPLLVPILLAAAVGLRCHYGAWPWQLPL